jgi:aromatic-L-amino-acid/L-tryptophan decarboxylase
VLVRDAAAMRRTFSLVPAYIRTSPEIAGPPWFSEFGVQQTRGFRALKVWMSLMHHGLDGYARSISRDIALAERLAADVEAAPDFELLGAGLSIVCFRYTATDQDLDELNQTLMTAIQLDGKAFLTGARVDGRFALRACFVNPRTRAEHVTGLLDLVRRAAASIARDNP